MTQDESESCSHPRTQCVLETVQLRDRQVRVETCRLCGRRTIDPVDASKFLERSRPGENGLNAGELALAILGLYPDREVDSKTLLMKEAFLVEKELARQIHLDLASLRFVPHKYGPYSHDFDTALRSMGKNGLVEITGDSKGRQAIALTEEGKRHAVEVLKELSADQIKVLQRKRKGWDQLGHHRILRKVYDEYPAYKNRPDIADAKRA